ncbi:hypothetical protein P691DRAFT_195876 [Macrolepiota fuliginosa MF-IS2]|uniref:Uncharacterized protein n=1 Tax=Macrolepiota fuliginosa MF-IS2 TaxID=1400762 RepID=A0A9P5XQN1_9AGAR|nr:hypothetical protein P691DRAFT_195876 [Macrolepiota fuliginosa MF-IS2]
MALVLQEKDAIQIPIGHGGDIHIQITLVSVIAISFAVLCIHYVQQKPALTDCPRNERSSETLTGLGGLVASNATFSVSKRYLYARLLCCSSLFSLSALELHGDLDPFSGFSWILRNSEVACYFYVTILVILALRVKSPSGRRYPLHHDSVIALIFFVYVYQYLWPLATYSRQPVIPMDIPLSSRIILLFVDGILFPLVTPYLEAFQPNNQEGQGLSLWSRLTYSYLDHLIYVSLKPSRNIYHLLVCKTCLRISRTAPHLSSIVRD